MNYDSEYNWIVLAGRCTWIRTNSLQKANDIAEQEVRMGRQIAEVFTLNKVSEFTMFNNQAVKEIYRHDQT